MADIFLSYKRSDRERIAPIVALLESCEWSVWWDTRIDAGERWDEIIEREIGSANCVRRKGVKGLTWAGFGGLAAGLLVIVPAILWLSGWLGGPQTRAASREPVADQHPVKIPKVKVVPVATSKVPVPPTSGARPKSREDDLLAQAKRRIESGDILGAREILQAPEAASSGLMTFMLAETYDPNMLAAWGARVAGNGVKAKALYSKARDLGDERAQQRLDWLR